MMDIDDTRGKCFYKGRGQDTHKLGEDDKIRLITKQAIHDVSFKNSLFLILVGDECKRDLESPADIFQYRIIPDDMQDGTRRHQTPFALHAVSSP